jgi:hypothetical protein
VIKFESQFSGNVGIQTAWFRLSIHDTLDQAKTLIDAFKDQFADQQPGTTQYRVIEYVPTIVYEFPEVTR